MTDIFDIPAPKPVDFAKDMQQALKQYQSAQPKAPVFDLASAIGEGLEAQNKRAEIAAREAKKAADAQAKAFAKAMKDNPAAGLSLLPRTWDQTRAGVAGYDQLPYEQQLEIYNQYVKGATEFVKSQNPGMDETDFAAELRRSMPPPVDPTGGRGDFRRGVAQYIPQTKAMLAGAAGIALDKLGAKETAAGLLASASAASEEAAKLSKTNDQFTEALKPEGSLIDWAQYTVGAQVGNLLESLATATAGAAIGGAAGGAGALPGAVVGALGKSLVKKELRDAVEKAVLESVEAQVKRGVARETAQAVAEREAQRKLAQA